MVMLINRRDMDRLALEEGQDVSLAAVTRGGSTRDVSGFRIHEYDIPGGCIGGYYPECDPADRAVAPRRAKQGPGSEVRTGRR